MSEMFMESQQCVWDVHGESAVCLRCSWRVSSVSEMFMESQQCV